MHRHLMFAALCGAALLAACTPETGATRSANAARRQYQAPHTGSLLSGQDTDDQLSGANSPSLYSRANATAH